MKGAGEASFERAPIPSDGQNVSTDTRLDVAENTDGRDLFQAQSRYAPIFREQQKWEGIYLGAMLVVDLAALAFVGLGGLDVAGVPTEVLPTAQRFTLLALGGLLGGLVYGGKWLYHSIAKGLWHQDRQMWRILSPWISLATTIGIWTLIDAGFFPPIGEPTDKLSLATPVGVGFVIGYLADRFLAKMKELTQVLFGQTEKHSS